MYFAATSVPQSGAVSRSVTKRKANHRFKFDYLRLEILESIFAPLSSVKVPL